MLHEIYGHGYVKYELRRRNSEKLEDINIIPELCGLEDIEFDPAVCLGVGRRIEGDANSRLFFQPLSH